MSKYIGSPVVSLSTDTVDVTGDITTTDATPEVIIVNDTHEDTDGGREGKLTFKGQQSGGEETTLAQIQASHDGTSDDEKGDLIFKTNDGSDGASPTERMRIDSNGDIVVSAGSDVRTDTAGTDNVKIGGGAGDSIVSGGDNNVVIGKNAGTAITTGDLNVAVGSNALAATTTHSNNVAIGAFAMDAGIGDHNVAIGSGALGGSSLASGENIAIGTDTLNGLTSGTENIAIGRDAGKGLTTGSNNVVLGNDALVTEDAHGRNVAIGWSALKNLDSGATGLDGENVAIGYDAGRNTNLGVYNTFVGSQAGHDNTAGDLNTFIGRASGELVTTGDNNTIVGCFDGNENGLDTRTSDRNVIMADGLGYPAFNTRVTQDGAATVDISAGLNNAVHNVIGIANAATVSLFSDANAFSGVFIFNEIAITGATGLIITGGGQLTIVNQNGGSTLVASSTPTSGKIGIFLDSLKVKVKNNQGSTCFFRVISFRTRMAQ